MELLNGKAKELFENWVINNPSGHDSQRMVKIYNQKELFISYVGIGNTLLNALIIEWLDSIGITVEINYGQISQSWIYNIKLYSVNNCTESFFASRQQATAEAIKKAVQLINESNGNSI